jgi:stage II sporulation protein D
VSSAAARYGLLVLLVSYLVPVSPAGASGDEAVRSLAAAAGQGTPLMRIGLEPDSHVEISSSGTYRILDPESGSKVWKAGFDGPLQVIAEGGPEQRPATVYRVQVGAFGSRDAAEGERARLEAAFGVPGVVRHNPDRGNWRVRLGRADNRLSLQPLMERLRAGGFTDLWISEEAGEEIGDVKLRLVDARFDSLLTDAARLVAVPGRRGRIEVNGRPYRGVVELRVNPFGQVRPINWVELEKYLLGVVPAELGPEVWPQIEALKAQSVAARTYAWRNRGQFAEEGFDLCATPRCQVYQGASAEHPLSDRAVAGTRGEILVWQGEPVDALYTATCGGHTEDGGEIFPDQDRPYLRGVPCRAENDALASLRATVRGQIVQPLHDETGRDVTRDWTLLRAAGVVERGLSNPAGVRGAVDPPALRSWTTALGRLAGLDPPRGPAGDTSTLGSAAAALLSDLGWSERAEVLLAEQDLAALLRDDELALLPETERRALAYLAWTESIRPFPDGRFRAEGSASGARLATALVQAGTTYKAFGLREGVVSGMGKNSIRLVRGKGEVRLPLAGDAFLFGLSGGRTVPAERLEIWPGDRVRYRTAAGGAIDFLELVPPVKGVSDDRSAAVYSWETRRSRREIEAAVNRRVSIGRLQDLQVVRRGVSGRVVELRVVGSKGEATVRGFDVRRLLDLRESLMVLSPQRDPAGRLEAVVFTGKGWGHGVGLCQVGAYGMALRGANYREILAHYYRGARLQGLSARDR